MEKSRKILHRIKLLSKTGEFEKCIELSRKAIAVIDRSNPEEWFELRFDLSNYLLEDENAPSEQVEEAISILNDLLNEIEKHQEAEKWAMVNIGLGYAYDKRVKGDKQKNVEKVIEYYKRALTVLDKDKYPKHWAAIKAGIGYAFAVKETGDLKSNIIEGILNIRDSLEYYSKEEHPEDYWDKIKELKRLKKLLNDDKFWDTLWD